VGLLPGLEFAVRSVTLERGDMLLAFTDGVADARSPDGASYGEPRLLAAAGAPSVQAVLTAIDADLDAHTAGAEPFDDITLLAVRRS